MAIVKFDLYAIPPDGDVKKAIRIVQSDESEADWAYSNEGMTKEESERYLQRFKEGYLGSWTRSRGYFSILRTYKDYTFELRRHLDTKWRQREERKFRNREYQPIPKEWNKLNINPDHFVHVAMDGEVLDQIAYTENEEKGMRDVQTRMRAGRYIKKFFPELSTEEVRYYSEAVQSSNGVQLTEDPELMAIVYENGPSSCMKYPPYHWGWYEKEQDEDGDPIDDEDAECLNDKMPRHPCAVYCAGDIQLAWLGDANAATARALVWPEKKLYGRIYGAVDRLKTALERIGYKDMQWQNGNAFAGARIKTIRFDKDQIVMPYLDGVTYFEYVKADGQLYLGKEHHLADAKSANIFRRSSNERGLCQFRDPTVQHCYISGKVIKEGDETAYADEWEEVVLKSELLRDKRWQMTAEGVYSRSVFIYEVEDRREIHSRYRWSMPRNAVRDILCENDIYCPVSECVTLRSGGHTRRRNLHKLISYKGHYYTSIQELYSRHPGLRIDAAMPISGPFTPNEHKELMALCNKWLKDSTSSSPSNLGYYGANMEECYTTNYPHFWALVNHFASAARRKAQNKELSYVA